MKRLPVGRHLGEGEGGRSEEVTMTLMYCVISLYFILVFNILTVLQVMNR